MSAPTNPGKAKPAEVLTIVCAGIVLANLDLFIVNVALPDIARDFGGASLGSLSWILNGYAIVYAALLVFCGRVAERYPRNLGFLAATGLFTGASAACACANSVETLVGFRLLQAAGAALLTPTSMGLILATFPADRRAGAVRTWAAIGGFAAALGPVVGGLLIMANWRWIFIVNVPIGLAGLLIGWWKLPDVPGHDVPRPDGLGAVLVTIGVGALTFGLVKTGDWGWRAPGVLLSLAVASILLAFFVMHCRQARNPLVEPGLFKVRTFTGGALVMAPFAMAFGAMLLSIVLWEQGSWGWSALKSGLAIAPGPLLVPITSLAIAGRLIKRFGAAVVASAGLTFFAGGCVWWALAASPQPSYFMVVGGIVMTGIGVGLTLPTVMGAASGSLPPSSFATGGGVINMIRQTGMAIGVAVLVAIVGTPGSMTDRVRDFQTAWWAMAAITAVGLIPALLMLRPKKV